VDRRHLFLLCAYQVALHYGHNTISWSPQHRDQYADGCPSAALLDEIARRPATTKQVFTDALMGVIDDVASRLDPTNAEAARTDALTEPVVASI
jgi:hypothetical protein